MHYTHRKHNKLALGFRDQTLTPADSVKSLSLWLDPKLKFHRHIAEVRKNGNLTLAQLHRLKKGYSGLISKEAKKLVEMVLKPRLLFGSIAWFHGHTEAKVSKLLTTFQKKS